MECYERLESDITLLPSQQSLTAAIQLSNGMHNAVVIVDEEVLYMTVVGCSQSPSS